MSMRIRAEQIAPTDTIVGLGRVFQNKEASEILSWAGTMVTLPESMVMISFTDSQGEDGFLVALRSTRFDVEGV